MHISVSFRGILTAVVMAVALCGLFLSVSTCESYDPSFANFVEESTAAKVREGFFEYEMTFPVEDGLERYDNGQIASRIMLVPAEGGENALPDPMPGGWILDKPVYHTDDGEYRRIDGVYSVACGVYALAVIIANPNSSAMLEKNILLSPGEPTAYRIDLTRADFKDHVE